MPGRVDEIDEEALEWHSLAADFVHLNLVLARDELQIFLVQLEVHRNRAEDVVSRRHHPQFSLKQLTSI